MAWERSSVLVFLPGECPPWGPAQGHLGEVRPVPGTLCRVVSPCGRVGSGPESTNAGGCHLTCCCDLRVAEKVGSREFGC